MNRTARKALVTGATGALGAAACRALARSGLRVLVHARRSTTQAEQLAQDIRAGGGAADTIVFDVTDARACTQALEAALADGPVQVLVNNAGVHADAPLAGMSAEQWHSVLDVSLNGFFNVTRPLLLPMISSRWGRIVNVSSVAAVLGNRGQANYAAAKAGLHGATRSLALELAPRGITVNTVAPGIIASPMTEKAFPPERIAALVPMKRAGTPEEVAALIAFLASEDAGYISGQLLQINGAMA